MKPNATAFALTGVATCTLALLLRTPLSNLTSAMTAASTSALLGQMITVNGIEYWEPDAWCDLTWNGVLEASEDGYYTQRSSGYSQQQIDLLYDEWRFDSTNHCIYKKATDGTPNYKTIFGVTFDFFDWGGVTSSGFVCDREGATGTDEDDIYLFVNHSMHANDDYAWTPGDVHDMLMIFADQDCFGTPTFNECLELLWAGDRLFQENFGRGLHWDEIDDLLSETGCAGRECISRTSGPAFPPYSKGDPVKFMVDRDGSGTADQLDLMILLAESKLCAEAEDPPDSLSDDDLWVLIKEWFNPSGPYIPAEYDFVDCPEGILWAEVAMGRPLNGTERSDLFDILNCDGDYRDPRDIGWRPPGEGQWGEGLPGCWCGPIDPMPIAPPGGGGSEGGGGGEKEPRWVNPIWIMGTQGRQAGLPMAPPGYVPEGDTPNYRDIPEQPGGNLTYKPHGWDDYMRNQSPPGEVCEPPIMMPVDQVYGDKLESITDLYVQLVGPDFRIIRTYSSDPDYVGKGAGMVGENWNLSVYHSLRTVGVGAHPDLELDAGQNRVITYEWNATKSKWLAEGSSTQYILDGTNVYTLVEPGQWEIDFNDKDQTDFALLIKERRDVYGTTHTFDWQTDDDDEYLRSIFLNGTTYANAEAVIDFMYNGDAGFRLKRIRVLRENSSGDMVETQSIEYTYFDSTDHHDAVGTAGDLVQVVNRLRVDQAQNGADPFREWVTQYRYHGGLTNETAPTDTDGDGFIEKGDAHQLKAVLLPEQIEYYVQQKFKDNLAEVAVISQEAPALLALADNGNLFGLAHDEIVMDLAAKVIAEYETTGAKRVKVQHIQASCGCGGTGAQSVKYEYSHDSGTTGSRDWHSMHVTESFHNGTSYTEYRKYEFDSEVLEDSGDIFYVVNRVKTEPVSGGDDKNWATHFEYDDAASSHHLEKIVLPSALAADTDYSPSTSSAKWSYTADTDGGFVYEFEANSDNRLEEIYVREGNGTVNPRHQIADITYGTGVETHLPSKLKLFQVAGDTTTQTNIETYDFDYGFHTSGGIDVGWIEVTLEAEEVAENGPDGTYEVYYLFDPDGNLEYVRAADGRIDKFAYDAATGQRTSIVINDIKPASSPYTYTPAIPNYGTWSDRNSDGGSLTYIYTYDLLGRLREAKSPGQVSAYRSYEMRTDDSGERRGVQYGAVVALPHVITGGSSAVGDGPISVTWITARGVVFRTGDYELGTSPTYQSTGGITGYTLGTELTRSTVQQNLVGLATSSRDWHSITRNDYYETTYVYDELGRLQDSTAPTGTITRRSYDVLDRLTKLEVGTLTTNLETAVELFYDHTMSGQDPVQGTGDGNLTYIREHSGEVDGSQNPIYRNSILTYDYRDRLTKVVSPEKPHTFLEYDNLDRVIKAALNSNSTGTGVGSNLTTRGVYVEAAYSQRGLPYRSRIATDPTLSSPDFIETHLWFDEVGRAVGEWGPNAPGRKITYDGLGRAEAVYLTDRGGDDAPGATGNYADVHASHASVLTGDVVLEEADLRYIETGNDSRGMLDLITSLVRTHDAPDSKTGALSALSGADAKYAITTYSGYYYDAADRIIREAEYGTNQTGFKYGGTAPTISQTSPPDADSAGDQLVTETTYNTRGLPETITDPTNIVGKSIYDDLNRAIASISAYANATVTWDATLGRWKGANLDVDKDLITSIIYDFNNKVIKEYAHSKNGTGDDVQVTEYHLGVTKGSTSSDSLLHSNDLVGKVIYPDLETGESEADHAVYFEYNRLGEGRYKKDQNKTEHFYTRDDLGRVTVDKITIGTGSAIDDRVNALAFTYDGFGRLKFARSYTDYGGGGQAIVNAIKYTFTKLWQVDQFWQDPDGDVVTSGQGQSLKIAHTWDTQKSSLGNYSRTSTLTYPNGLDVDFDYGAANGVNDIISRLRALNGAKSSTAIDDTFAQYDYIGLQGVAIVDYADIDVQLNYKLKHNGKDPAGEYGSLDRFGRIARQAWVDGNFTTHSTDNTVPNIPPIVERAFAYDKVSNVTQAYDDRPGSGQPLSHDYKYDDLHRLKEAERGLWSGSDVPQGVGSQQFTLDILQNFTKIETDADGTNGYESDETENRTDFSDANELNGRDTDNDSTDDIDIEYDFNGNMTCSDPGGVATKYTFDAWNRLVKVAFDTGTEVNTVAEYEYNAIHQRTIRRFDSDLGDLNDAPDEERELYYSIAWQLLEERIDDDYVNDPGVNSHVQYIWGALYIDDIVLRRLDANADGDFEDVGDEYWYHLTDPQFSTVAILNGSATVVERVTYDAFGEARHHPYKDVDGDGDYDSTDYNTISNISVGLNNKIGESNYRSEADLDRDGDVDSTDVTLAGTNYVAALAKGDLSDPAVDNIVGWSGYLFDREIGLYCVRFRYFDVDLMRWVNRDPAGHVDSMNLYGYASGNSIFVMDPFGLYPELPGSGIDLETGEMIGFDQMRGMTFWEKVAAGHYDKTFRALRIGGTIGTIVFSGGLAVIVRYAPTLLARLGILTWEGLETFSLFTIYGGALAGRAVFIGGRWVIVVGAPWMARELMQYFFRFGGPSLASWVAINGRNAAAVAFLIGYLQALLERWGLIPPATDLPNTNTYFDIPYQFGKGVGDLGTIWEMNRCDQ